MKSLHLRGAILTGVLTALCRKPCQEFPIWASVSRILLGPSI